MLKRLVKNVGRELRNVSGGIIRYTTKAFEKHILRPIGREIKKLLGIPNIEDFLRDRKQMVRSAAGPRRLIYGEARVGGHLVYAEVTGAKDEHLHLVLLLAGHEVEAIGDVYLGEFRADDERFAGLVQINRHLGTDDQGADADLVAASSTWTTAHRLRGIAYLYVHLTYNEDAFPSGLPNISAVVRGRRVLDPRTGATGWSANWALCVYDYMRHPLGMGCAPDEIDTDTVIAAANVSDEAIRESTRCFRLRRRDGNHTQFCATFTERRYTCNGSVEIGSTALDGLQQLRTAGNGVATYIQGRWRLYAGAYSAPVMHLDEDDLAGGITVKTGASKREKANTVRGVYVDPFKNWEPTDFPLISAPAYVAADKEELVFDLPLPFTNSPSGARRIAKQVMERSRRGLTVQHPCKYTALPLTIWDTVTISNQKLGWDHKEFKVIDYDFHFERGVVLTLQEEDEAIYTWTEGDEIEVEQEPLTNLPNPWSVAAPTGLAYTESLYVTNVEAVVKARVTLSWDAGAAGIRYYEVQEQVGGEWVTVGEPPEARLRLDDVAPGAYAWRVRAINSLDVKSPWAMLSATILGKTAAPGNITGFTATIRRFGVELSWNAVADLDLDFYEIREGASWATATVLQRTPGAAWTWDFRTAGAYKLWVAARDTSKIYSAAPSSTDVVIQAPGQVPPIQPEVIKNFVLLRWAEPSTGSLPLEAYEVRRGATWDTAEVVGVSDATFTTIFETVAGNKTYWVAASDVAGNAGPPRSIVAYVDEPPDFILRADDALALAEGTANNAYVSNGDLYACVDTVETWAQHFSARAWDTIEDQINAGYPLYAQPTELSAAWEKVIDYEATLGSTRVTVTPNLEPASGTVAVAVTISHSVDGTNWTDLEDTAQAFITQFRYLKVRLDFEAATNTDLVRLAELRVKLDVSLKTDAGKASVDAGDAGGTVVEFNLAFVDVESITVTPKGTQQRTAVYDFDDAPNPTQFRVYLFDSTGARVSGDVSWAARGV